MMVSSRILVGIVELVLDLGMVVRAGDAELAQIALQPDRQDHILGPGIFAAADGQFEGSSCR